MEEVVLDARRVNSRVMSRGPSCIFLSALFHPAFFSFLFRARAPRPRERARVSRSSTRRPHSPAREHPRVPTDGTGRSSSSFEFENTAISVTASAAALCVYMHTYVYLVHPVPRTLRLRSSFFSPVGVSRRPRCRLPTLLATWRFYRAGTDCPCFDVLSLSLSLLSNHEKSTYLETTRYKVVTCTNIAARRIRKGEESKENQAV